MPSHARFPFQCAESVRQGTGPFFSVIVPTHDRPVQIECCFQAIARLRYSRQRFEVIVVDDGIGAGIEAIVERFKKTIRIRLIVQEHAGSATARNRGAAEACGNVLAFLDDDCEPAEDWLLRLAASGAESTAVGGPTINRLKDNPFSTASQLLVDFVRIHFNRAPSQACFPTTNNLAFPAQQFREVGGFDVRFPLAAAEDRELCDRWAHGGLSMAYSPDVLVYHSHDLSLRSFCKQHFNYGRGAAVFRRLRDPRDVQRPRLRGPFFYVRLVVFPFSRLTAPRAFAAATLLALAASRHRGRLPQRNGERLASPS